jgi:hypothetical protein
MKMQAHERISRFGKSPQLGIILFRPCRRSAQRKCSKRTALNSPLAKIVAVQTASSRSSSIVHLPYVYCMISSKL